MRLSDKQLEFVEALRSNKHTLPQLSRKLESVLSAEQFLALLSVFTETNHYGHQQTAAKLCLDHEPICDEALSGILTSIAPTWNLSVEELPHFLAKCFDRQTVVECATDLALNHHDGTTERKALETVAWWLKRESANGG